MSGEMQKFVARYGDEYGNTSWGLVVFTGCSSDEDYIEVVSPQSMREHSGYISISNVVEIQNRINVPVGYYTRRAHFEILKNLRCVDGLNSHSREKFEKLTDDDTNQITSYSMSNDIIHELHGEQTVLYTTQDLPFLN